MDKKCHYCGDTGDLRPYGPKGSWVCYPCATTPEHSEETKRNFDAQLGAAIAAGSGSIILTDAGPAPLGGKRD